MYALLCCYVAVICFVFFFFSSRRRHTRLQGDWSSDVCSSDLHRRRRPEASRVRRGHRRGVLERGKRTLHRHRRRRERAHLRRWSIPSRVLRDRKSTRLNSSHLVMSYAVFCLKKKSQPSPTY